MNKLLGSKSSKPTTAAKPVRSRPPKGTHKIDKRFFLAALDAAGLSQRGLAKLMELDVSAISLLLDGARRMHLDDARKLSRFLNVPIHRVLAAADLPMPAEGVFPGLPAGTKIMRAEMPQTPPPTVKIMGSVDSAGRVMLSSAQRDTRLPMVPKDVIALEGANGCIYFCQRPTTFDPRAVGRLACVRLIDDLRLARLTVGDDDNWHLTFADGTSIDAHVDAASPVLLIKP